MYFIITRYTFNIIEEYIYVNKNKSYVELLEYFCKISYEQVYKDQILAFSSSGFRVDGEVLETSGRNFVKLTTSLMGIRNIRYLSKFFGGSDNLTQNMLIWFKIQFDNDEVLEYVEKQKTNTTDIEDNTSTKLTELEEE